jgi:hypothetical protein
MKPSSFALAFVLLGVTLASGSSVRSPRTTVPFDFGWKHRLGLHKAPGPPPPSPPPAKCGPGNEPFPVNMTAVRCLGLNRAPEGKASPEACELACCKQPSCAVWQWSSPPSDKSKGCWIGNLPRSQCTSPDPIWQGGWRDIPVPGPPANPQPGPNPPEAQITYDDSSWEDVQLPHDGLIKQAPSNTSCPEGCSGKSYIPRHPMWYRKQFKLPNQWDPTANFISLKFEGVFRLSTVYVNGKNVSFHECGYTSFQVELDTDLLAATPYDDGTVTIAVFVDPDNGDQGSARHGSGWWYEGGGIYRHVKLVKTDTKAHVADDGLFVYSNVSLPSSGTVIAILHASVEVEGDLGEPIEATFTVFDQNEKVVAVATASGTTPSIVRASMNLEESGTLWTPQNPHLYHVVASIARIEKVKNIEIDRVGTYHGLRTLHYDANNGFFLNQEHFKVRGFCDHNNLGVVGMAVPDRLNLFRAQASRSVGGNGRRTSHNPPNPEMLDIYDRIGIVVMDENRLFANYTPFVENMGKMVKRDRNHPSVVIWSFCNEAGCEGTQEEGGPRFREIAYDYDGTRPTLANMFTFNDLLSKTIDVQGFSHRDRQNLDNCHAEMPNKPIFMSECCSCNTMRDEDVGCESSDGSDECTQKSFNADCVQAQTNASNGADYAIGTMVWTLFDYYGEPSGNWPHTTSTFGQFDLSGFPKAAAYWYRAHWLNRIPDSNSDKTFKTGNDHFVHIVESWESPDTFPSTKGNKTRNMTFYTDMTDSDGATFEISVNNGFSTLKGKAPKDPNHSTDPSWIEFDGAVWESGNITAKIFDKEGNLVAQDVRYTSGAAISLKLSVDCPSAATGTGDALVLDGQDTGLIRASVVDEHGRVVHMASQNITFEILSGPGRVVGTNNGDPACHDPNHIPWKNAYHGLARGVIMVTSAAAFREEKKELLMEMGDVNEAFVSVPNGDNAIVVRATSPGLKPGTVTIPVSTDLQTHGVMAIAAKSAGKPVSFFP